MGSNAAIYLPYADVRLQELLPDVSTDGNDSRPPTFFEFNLGGDLVRLNVMPADELASHRSGFTNYIRRLGASERRTSASIMLVEHTETVLGLLTDATFETNEQLWPTLLRIAGEYSGFVFVYDSIVLPNGGIVIGPLVDEGE